ncbi:hypothetical protein HYW42_03360 [Candidatus Daviesbacteria bacterium]|nr:hypothetical protein [Candidatus Daviesbacteria bacterium]
MFTPLEFSRIFQAPPHSIKYFLETQVQEGLFLRLKQGLYTLRTNPPNEREIANRLYKPSYISFAYALAYYNILPEMPYQITSATTKPTRVFTATNQTFSYYSIKEKAFTGYLFKQEGDKSFLVADPEKALVDYVYFATLGRGPSLDRLNIASLSKEKALRYAKLYDRKSLSEKIENLFSSPRKERIV